MKIVVQFFNQPDLEICVDDTETGRRYFELTRHTNQIQPPFYRDTMTYTPEYMIELAHRASQAFGWNWLTDSYDISVTTQLHKDLENWLGKLSFDQIPAKHDDLLYELHHCLHAIQFGKTAPGRLDNLQIEWFTDQSVPLPESFAFQESCLFGDLILINPYVGHNPLQIYLENDFSALHTTCRFHDVIKPGIVLTNQTHETKQNIVDAFLRHDPDFVKTHGQDKIKYYAGSAVIGRVSDRQLFGKIKNSPDILILDRIDFYE